MTESPLTLAGDFVAPSRQDWETEVLKVLNRRRPEGKELSIEQAMKRLTTTTVDDLVIDPLYTKESRAKGRDLGHPAVSPFTRGSTLRDGTIHAWDICALHEDPDAGFSSAAVLADLTRGATSLWLRVDSDAIAPAALPTVLAGVLPELAPISVSSRTEQDAAASALAEFWRASGQSAQVAGNLGLDALGQAARTGAAPDYTAQREWVATALAEFPKARAVAVDSLVYDDAGAGDVDVLAFAIATGVEYLRDLEAVGIAPADAFGELAFRVPANTDQFMTIARLRALRRLWARVGEVSGVPAQRRGALQLAVTSWRMITRDDPWVNLLRGTIATFAASVGGAESVTVLPHDTAWGLPTDFSRRMARNIQLLAAEESNLGRVADPAGGSWYVESLTDQLAGRAWARFGEIEAAGGMAAALADGRVADWIGSTVAARGVRLANRRQPITGVSMFPGSNEQPLEVRPRPERPVFGGLVPRRDSEVFEALRDRVAAATSKPQVFLACLGARRDFGPREQFTSNVLLVAGIERPSSEGGTTDEIVEQVRAAGAKTVILCSSAKVYAAQAVEVATALKDAGVATVLIAGRRTETGAENAADVIDGEIFDGMDVAGFLAGTLDELGVDR
ncbi:MAG: methylmalonyl-CoA mutase family protein [Micropruina sp.]|uniref:methylmalonyl-CoA mutase family protein n=1 Tax=Micropruina sp. TaxID=2737536 RepID=UPI0039E39DB7